MKLRALESMVRAYHIPDRDMLILTIRLLISYCIPSQLTTTAIKKQLNITVLNPNNMNSPISLHINYKEYYYNKALDLLHPKSETINNLHVTNATRCLIHILYEINETEKETRT